MQQTLQTDGQQPVVSPAGVDVGRLEQWHKEYMAVDGDRLDPTSSIVLSVNSDHIDVDYIESQVQQAIPATHVSRGYCNSCHDLFGHWPDLGTRWWAQAVGRPHRTEQLEAGTRGGCRSCSFLSLRLKDAGLLDTFRRIEKRLSLLNDTVTASISIQNWASGNSQLLWLNFPGKVTTHCNSACAHPTKFESHIVPLPGKQSIDSRCIRLTSRSKLL
jgi:hypothetical protein